MVPHRSRRARARSRARMRKPVPIVESAIFGVKEGNECEDDDEEFIEVHGKELENEDLNLDIEPDEDDVNYPGDEDEDEEYVEEPIRYTKIQDSWYRGPTHKEFPDGVYHLHARRGGKKFSMRLTNVWRLESRVDDNGNDLDTKGMPIFSCHDCGTIAPDEIASKFCIDRRAAVEATRRKQQQD